MNIVDEARGDGFIWDVPDTSGPSTVPLPPTTPSPQDEPPAPPPPPPPPEKSGE